MKKDDSYFNFGLILVITVVVIQFLLMISLKLLKNSSSLLLIFTIPTILAATINFIWYQQKKLYLKSEQYWIAVMPVLLFLGSGLAVVYRNYLHIELFNIFLLLSLFFYTVLRILINNLIIKFGDESIRKRVSVKSFFYLFGYTLLMWLTTSIMFHI